jgi:hypothetical protein
MTLAALVLSLVGQTAGQSLLSQLFTGPRSGGPDQPPGQTNERFTAQLPAVTEKPVVADRLTPRQRETSGPSEVTGTVSREASITSRKTSPPPQETSTPPPVALQPTRPVPRRKPEPARARAAAPDSAPCLSLIDVVASVSFAGSTEQFQLIASAVDRNPKHADPVVRLHNRDHL